MAKFPWIKWFTGAWLSDPCVARLSPASRGIWKDFLDSMHELDSGGQLSGTRKELARLGRCSPDELAHCLDELSSTGAADVTERNGVMTVTNRRMRREWEARKANADRQKRFRENQLPLSGLESNASVTPDIIEDRGKKKDNEKPSLEIPKALDSKEFRTVWGQWMLYRMDKKVC
jgi:hypothetical protein